RLDEPACAEVEAALDAGQAVVVAVAIDGRAVAEGLFDGLDGAREALIVGRNQARAADRESRGVHEAVVESAGKAAAARAEAALQDFVADPVAALEIVLARAAEELLADLRGAVEGEPAHDLGVHVVTARDAGFPDAVVGVLPPMCYGVGEVLDEFPVLAGER